LSVTSWPTAAPGETAMVFFHFRETSNSENGLTPFAVAVVNAADRVVKGLYRLPPPPRRIGDMHFSRLTKRPQPPPANSGNANGNGKKPVKKQRKKNLSFLLYIIRA